MRILVVEDEARILSVVSRALEAEGYAVVEASDGRDALALALGDDWSLIVLDLLLPGLSGLELLRRVRAARPDLPVLVLSARSDISTKLRSFSLGADDYIAKPFSVNELLARVRVQLRHTRAVGEGGLVRGTGLVLDTARRQARSGDNVWDLSEREFRLLHYLLVNEGEVVSRERLLAAVWGSEFDPRSNVVEVCVRRLRNKLSPGSIETVRYAGYRLVVKQGSAPAGALSSRAGTTV